MMSCSETRVNKNRVESDNILAQQEQCLSIVTVYTRFLLQGMQWERDVRSLCNDEAAIVQLRTPSHEGGQHAGC